jgi:hypothetical protein
MCYESLTLRQKSKVLVVIDLSAYVCLLSEFTQAVLMMFRCASYPPAVICSRAAPSCCPWSELAVMIQQQAGSDTARVFPADKTPTGCSWQAAWQ